MIALTAGERDALILAQMPRIRARACWFLRTTMPWNLTLDDLISVGVVRVIECLDRWDGIRNFGPYAASNAEGGMLDEIRRLTYRAGRTRPVFVDQFDWLLLVSCDALPDADAAQAEARRAIERAMLRLSKQERIVIELMLAGLNQAEIGVRLDLGGARINQVKQSAFAQMRSNAALAKAA